MKRDVLVGLGQFGLLLRREQFLEEFGVVEVSCSEVSLTNPLKVLISQRQLLVLVAALLSLQLV